MRTPHRARFLVGLVAALLSILIGAGPVAAQTPGPWVTTGSMGSPRAEHTATLLADGTVLVAGGRPAFVSASQLYDPTTGGWTATTSMNPARTLHTATLLNDGRVLMVGGYDANGRVGADLYNPTSKSWQSAGTQAVARLYHTATLLADGRVLVAAGENGTFAGPAAQVYDPAAGTWTTTGAMAAQRVMHTATRLNDGTVLVTGGIGQGAGIAEIATSTLYHPATGTWSSTGSLGKARYHHTATLLASGKVLVAGGYANSGGATPAAELYDPVAKTWSPAGTLTAGRYFHEATLLANGKVLVTGGIGTVDNLTYDNLKAAEIYDPATNAWTSGGSLNTERNDHTATRLTDGRVLVAGGFSNQGFSATAELYVAVPADTTPPVTTAGASPGPNAGGWNKQVVFVSLTATDNAAGVPTIAYELDNAGWIQYAVPIPVGGEGTHTLRYRSTDAANNVESPKTLVIKIDLTVPTIQASAAHADGSPYTAGAWSSSDVQVTFVCTDAGGSGIATNTVAGATFAESRTTTDNTGSCVDGAGNVAQPAIFGPINVDKVPPEIVAPPPVTLHTGPGATACGVPSNSSFLGSPTVSDNSGLPVAVSGVPPDGTFLPVNPPKTITYLAKDLAGNEATAIQTITVVDDTAPTLVVPASVFASTGLGSTSPGVVLSNAALGITAASAGDNCGAVGPIAVVGVPSGNFFPIGQTTLTYGVVDSGNNTAEAFQLVTVTDDTPPVIAFSAATSAGPYTMGSWSKLDVTVSFTCTDNGLVLAAGSASAWSVVLATQGAGQSVAGSCTDNANNKTDVQVGAVNVDKTAPTLTVPAGLTVDATSPAGAPVSYLPAPAAIDALDPAPTLACTPPSGTSFGIGDTVVTCSATDHAGNPATATFTVTVKSGTAQVVDLLQDLGTFGLSNGVYNPLSQHLSHARDKYNGGHLSQACDKLDQFIAGVDDAEDDGDLSSSEADGLRLDAERIKDVFGCG